MSEACNVMYLQNCRARNGTRPNRVYTFHWKHQKENSNWCTINIHIKHTIWNSCHVNYRPTSATFKLHRASATHFDCFTDLLWFLARNQIQQDASDWVICWCRWTGLHRYREMWSVFILGISGKGECTPPPKKNKNSPNKKKSAIPIQ